MDVEPHGVAISMLGVILMQLIERDQCIDLVGIGHVSSTLSAMISREVRSE